MVLPPPAAFIVGDQGYFWEINNAALTILGTDVMGEVCGVERMECCMHTMCCCPFGRDDPHGVGGIEQSMMVQGRSPRWYACGV